MENQIVFEQNNKLNGFMEYLLIFLLVFFDEKTFLRIYIVPSFVQIILFAIPLVYFLIVKKIYNKTLLDYRMIVILLTLYASMLLSTLISLDAYKVWIKMILILFIAFLCVYCMPLERFAKKYCNVMFILACYSIIVTVICNLIPELADRLFSIITHGSNQEKPLQYYNAVFSFYCKTTDRLHNIGPFTEQGIYQFFLIMAIIFSLSLSKISYYQLIIFILGVCTTGSTAGIVCLLIIIISFSCLACYYKNWKLLFSLVFPIVFFILFVLAIDVAERLLQDFDKLSGGGSFDSRLGSLRGAIMAWAKKPIFGWGYTGANSGSGAFFRQWTKDNTNTTFFLFACFGIVFGGINLVGFFNFYKRRFKNLFCLVAVLISIFLSVNNECFLSSLFFYVIVFYGLVNTKKGNNF